MSPEQYRLATGVAAFLAFFSLVYLLHWQVRIWPDDRQKWAATVFVFMTAVVVGQLCLSYLQWFPAMGTGPRGFVSFILWSLSTFGLAYESRKHIRKQLAKIEKIKNEAGQGRLLP